MSSELSGFRRMRHMWLHSHIVLMSQQSSCFADVLVISISLWRDEKRVGYGGKWGGTYTYTGRKVSEQQPYCLRVGPHTPKDHTVRVGPPTPKDTHRVAGVSRSRSLCCARVGVQGTCLARCELLEYLTSTSEVRTF